MTRRHANGTRPVRRSTYICGADLRGPGHDRFEGPAKQAIETGRNRLLVACSLFAFGFFIICGRLIDVAVFQQGGEPALARTAPARTAVVERADIVDRNGIVLATSLATASLYADPREILDAGAATAKLVAALPELNPAEVERKLRSKRHFVWLHRNLTPRQQVMINGLGVPGLHFQRGERRVYPHGPLASHLLGFTGIDNNGQAGVERYFDASLGRGDDPLQLSVDIRVQHVLRDELAQAMREQRALGASGLVMDLHKGEIVAMVSLPDFDPNRPPKSTDPAHFNRNTLGIYEMGSTFKLFTTAMALEYGVADLDDVYETNKPIRVARYSIRDLHPRRKPMTVPEILIRSSNVGAARMAIDVGTARQRAFLDRLGMFRKPALELREIGAPKQPGKWREINTMTVAFGHGVSVSPLQLASGVAAIANGGVLRSPTLLKQPEQAAAPGRRVISTRTSALMRGLMHRVVQEGTGKRAAVPGYAIGGKTGTAEKIENGRYQRNKMLSSFVGVFPIGAPRYVTLVMIDEPKGDKGNIRLATGGRVAAPVVGRIVARASALLGIEPVLDAEEDEAPLPQEPLRIIRASVGGGAFVAD